MATTEKSITAKKIYTYPQRPENLEDYKAFIKISNFNYNMRLYGSSLLKTLNEEQRREYYDDLSKKPQGHVFLPIPNALSLNDSIKYDENKGGTTIANRTASTLYEEAIKKRLGGVIAPYETVIETGLGKIFNTFLVHTFKGINLREYKYTWDFIPYSQEDADELNRIIVHLRKHALPKYDSDSFTINYPDYWVIEPMINGKLLFELNYLVLADINVEYGSEGRVTFFHDGTPVSTKLSLTFKEVYPAGSELVKDAIQNYANIGDELMSNVGDFEDDEMFVTKTPQREMNIEDLGDIDESMFD